MDDLNEGSSNTTTEFTIEWSQPNGGVDGYRVWVGSSDPYIPRTLAQTSYTVTDRQPATQYTVQVAAVVGDIESDRRSLDVTTSM